MSIFSNDFEQRQQQEGLCPNLPTTTAIQELENVANNYGLGKDPQTHMIIKFIAAANNYSSQHVANGIQDKIRLIGEILKIKNKIIKEIEKDLKKYKELERTLKELVRTFLTIFKTYKNNVRAKLSRLELSKNQLKILIEVLYPDELVSNEGPLKKLTKGDLDDNSLALKTLSKNLYEFAQDALINYNQCQSLKCRLNDFQRTKIQPEQETVKKRLKLFGNREMAEVGALAGGAVAGGAIVGGCIAAPVLGTAGTLALAGVVFPPAAIVGAVILCIAGGAIVISGATALIIELLQNPYIQHQSKVIGYLEQLSELTRKLTEGTDQLENFIIQSRINTTDLATSVDAIGLALQSERQRNANATICKRALISSQLVIESIKELDAIEIDAIWDQEIRALDSHPL